MKRRDSANTCDDPKLAPALLSSSLSDIPIMQISQQNRWEWIFVSAGELKITTVVTIQFPACIDGQAPSEDVATSYILSQLHRHVCNMQQVVVAAQLKCLGAIRERFEDS